MRTSLVVIGTAVAALVAGCGGAAEPESRQSATSSESGASGTSVPLPPEPEPAAEGECPYLDTEFVAQTNGQRVGSVRTSSDTNPACFFYRPDGDVQLTVRVYVGEEEVARTIVDDAAPVATSNPTAQPTGWEGGYESGDDGAVYAVSKGGHAVVVRTNQQQSVKARSVAVEAITRLGF